MEHEAVFSAAEFGERRMKVRQAMAERGIDTLITHSAPNIYYLTGHHTLNLWDYQCLVLPQSAEPFMVLWHFERGRFEASTVDTQAEYYDTLADPIDCTVEAVRRRGLAVGRLGIDAHSLNLLPAQYLRLCQGFEPLPVVDSSTLIELVRMVKSHSELEIMRQAAEITDGAMRVAFETVREGVSDTEICAAVSKYLVEHRSLAFAVHPMVAAGYRAGVPHSLNAGYSVKRGENVFLEWSPTLHWYNASLIRTVVVGAATARALEFESIAREAIEAICETLRAGTPACAVAAVGRNILAPVRSEITFHEYYGYPTGIGFPPTWDERSGFNLVADNEREVADGMTFHIPINLRIHGQWGVGMSQTVVVTEGGAKALSQLPLAITIID